VIVVADSSSGIPIINTNPSIPIHHPVVPQGTNSMGVNSCLLVVLRGPAQHEGHGQRRASSEGSSTYYHEVTTRPISLDLAHRRLGHIGESRVKVLTSRQAEGLKLLSDTSYRSRKCDHCIAGKIKILLHPRTQPTLRRADRPMEMLHLDLLQGGMRLQKRKVCRVTWWQSQAGELRELQLPFLFKMQSYRVSKHPSPPCRTRLVGRVALSLEPTMPCRRSEGRGRSTCGVSDNLGYSHNWYVNH